MNHRTITFGDSRATLSKMICLQPTDWSIIDQPQQLSRLPLVWCCHNVPIKAKRHAQQMSNVLFWYYCCNAVVVVVVVVLVVHLERVCWQIQTAFKWFLKAAYNETFFSFMDDRAHFKCICTVGKQHILIFPYESDTCISKKLRCWETIYQRQPRRAIVPCTSQYDTNGSTWAPVEDKKNTIHTQLSILPDSTMTQDTRWQGALSTNARHENKAIFVDDAVKIAQLTPKQSCQCVQLSNSC